MTTDDALAMISKRRFIVANLFQHRGDGSWQANLRSVDGEAYDFGLGMTPMAALLAALEKTEPRVTKPATAGVFD